MTQDKAGIGNLMKKYYGIVSAKLFSNRGIFLACLTIFFLSLTRCVIAFRLGQYGVRWDDSILSARKTLGGLDAGSYMQGAISLSNGSYKNPTNSFIWNLWPPGLPIYEFIFVKIFGTNIPILLVLAVTASTLVAGVSYIFLRAGVESKSRTLSLLILVFLLTSSVFQGWLLDQGIMYAENFYIFFGLLSLLLMKKATSDAKPYFYLVGLFLSMSAFFRAVGFIEIEMLAAVFIASLIVYNILSRSKYKREGSGNYVSQTMKIFLGSLPLVTFWSIFHHSWAKFPITQWVSTGDQSWRSDWATDAQMQTSGWGIAKGIDNWACHLEPIKCLKIQLPSAHPDYFTSALGTIISHPFSFFYNRSIDIWHYWILNGRWLYPPQNKLPLAFSYAEGICFLTITMVAVLSICVRWRSNIALKLFQAIVLIGSTFPLLFFHLESRYLIPCKVFSSLILITNFGDIKLVTSLLRARINNMITGIGHVS